MAATSLPFQVWDANTDLPPIFEQVSGMVSAERVVVMVGLPRGASPDRVLTVYSYDPAVVGGGYNAMALHALGEFVPRLVRAAGRSLPEASSELSAQAMAGGAGTTLTVGRQPVPARRFEVEATGDWAVVTTDTQLCIAISGPSGVPCPDLRGATWDQWSDAINRHVPHQA